MIPLTPATPTPTSLHAPGQETTSDIASTLRTTKRKLDDAFQSLDTAVGPSEVQRPSPAKKSHTIRSLYSTLAKYGIKTKESRPASAVATESPATTKSTPHLTAILTRAATRTRKAFPFKFSTSSSTAPALPPTADYRPSSLPAFLLRLATFKLSTYANKPTTIDAVAAAKCGWINDGKDRLVCGLCKSSWVVVGRDGMNKDAANALLEKQRASLVELHKNGCPWKTRQCDPTIYRIPLQSPATMVKDIKSNAISLDHLVRNIEIKHPLTSTQISSLQSTVSSVTVASPASQSDSSDNPEDEDTDVFMSPPGEISIPSTTAILTSLFGWILAPAAVQEPSRPPPLTRGTSLASAPRTPGPGSISRASSVRPMTPTRATTPPPSALQGAPTTHPRLPSSQFTFRAPANVNFKHDTTPLLYCALCQRRVGLWAFAPQPNLITAETPSASLTTTPRDSIEIGSVVTSAATTAQFASPAGSTAVQPTSSKKATPHRQFDLLKEHRSYCPYVVRSTVVPTLPVPPVTGNANLHRSNSAASHVSSVQIGNGIGSSAIEGWRAVLTVVLRYGAGQRHRLGLDFADRLRRESGTSTGEGVDTEDVDSVKAMVAGVKSRGGKDLLRYVKGLLG
ncbi:hypothetical protein DXG03_002288 [Asterophora parasitica]|uniref:Zf-C3HC-domain-containing protein n=1 Tax=Asterophora parasitica TaxID=117018 RepID=A0A9P7G8N1_9AGAR|nr:hypothetical protein DXG03_002288 [Asterophora parasitica]